ncbi:hypothetical protein Tco_1207542 [Tanacetum coccineum]
MQVSFINKQLFKSYNRMVLILRTCDMGLPMTKFLMDFRLSAAVRARDDFRASALLGQAADGLPLRACSNASSDVLRLTRFISERQQKVDMGCPLYVTWHSRARSFLVQGWIQLEAAGACQ